MSIYNYTLYPHYSNNLHSDLILSGKIERTQEKLSIYYELKGDLSCIIFPQQSKNFLRVDNLWKKTCFEFFISIKNTKPYWEFNLSPTGDWNVYYFTNYRQGMIQESSFKELPFNVILEPEKLQLTIEIMLMNIVDPKAHINIALSSVIIDSSGDSSFWALKHFDSEPNFHHRQAFLIEL